MINAILNFKITIGIRFSQKCRLRLRFHCAQSVPHRKLLRKISFQLLHIRSIPNSSHCKYRFLREFPSLRLRNRLIRQQKLRHRNTDKREQKNNCCYFFLPIHASALLINDPVSDECGFPLTLPKTGNIKTDVPNFPAKMP